MLLKKLIVAVALLAGPATVLAHDQDKGPNGGQVTEFQGHHIEFTTKGEEIVLYLTDAEGKPIQSKGASGRVVILEGGKQASAELVPVDPNLLEAKLDSSMATGTKVVVSAKLGDGHDLQARFVAK